MAGSSGSGTVAAELAELEALHRFGMTTEQGAELIGQVQHLIELAEASAGRSPYAPIVVDLSAGTSQSVDLPAEAHQIESVQTSSDTAATVKVYLKHQNVLSTSGQLIAQVFNPANQATPVAPLNCPVPPTSAKLTITTSAPVTTGAVIITLGRTRPGGYPYAG